MSAGGHLEVSNEQAVAMSDTDTGDHTRQQQPAPETDNTEVEPFSDSPAGARIATGRVFDQQNDSLAAAVTLDLINKSHSPQSPKQHQVPQPVTKGPDPGTAHVHLIGEITGAVGLGQGPLYCTWQLVYDTQQWRVTAGLDKGRTHASSPVLAEDVSVSGVVWECPINVLFSTNSMQHWPSIVFKLFHRSIWLGRDEFVGYSLCTLPNTPGCHLVRCPVWVAAEGRHSLSKELTKLFTGLHPQLVDESFITDLEQRYEQGQHLHTVACSSCVLDSCCPPGSDILCTGSACIQPGGKVPMWWMHCSSNSAASSAQVAAAGNGIGLRLHVLARGTQQLSRLQGRGMESIGHCLERLHSSVEKLRRQCGKPRLQDIVAADSDSEDCTEAAGESQGTQLVRQGRAARLQMAHTQLFGAEGDRHRGRDQRGSVLREHPRAVATSRQVSDVAVAAGSALQRLADGAGGVDGSRVSNRTPANRLSFVTNQVQGSNSSSHRFSLGSSNGSAAPVLQQGVQKVGIKGGTASAAEHESDGSRMPQKHLAGGINNSPLKHNAAESVRVSRQSHFTTPGSAVNSQAVPFSPQ